MNAYQTLRLIWRERVAALACAALGFCVAILIAFHVSLAPPSLRARSLQLGVAGVQVLVDSGTSAVSQVHAPTQRLGGLAATYVQLMSNPQVIDPVARSIHVAPSAIGVTEQVTAALAIAQTQPLEPQVGVEILAARKRYTLTVRNDSGSQVIQIYTQAQNGSRARTLAGAAAHALHDYVAALVRREHVSKRNAVVIRQLGPVVGRTLDPNASTEAAILIGLAAWLFAFIGVLTVKGQAHRAHRARTGQAQLFGA